MAIRTRAQLIDALSRAAELEHSAICQYLYAAHSLKNHPTESGVNEAELERVREWQATILLIARGEMEHLGLVGNLLTAVGAKPVFQRPGFPCAGPCGLDFGLEPFSEQALERFIALEAAHDEGGVFDLYASIRQGFLTLDAESEPLFVGNPRAQTSNRSLGLPPGWYDIQLLQVADVATALTAIDRILEAGDREPSGAEAAKGVPTKGIETPPPPTHRERFEAALFDFRALSVAAGADFQPVRPVVSNPATCNSPGANCTVIDEPITRDAVCLFNAAYHLMLVMLHRFYAPGDETEEERSFLGKLAFRPLMTIIVRPMAEMLTHMPATKERATSTAGPTFEIASDLQLPGDPHEAWRLMRDRLRDLHRGSLDLHRKLAGAAALWTASLAPRAAFLAENLEAMAISFEHQIEIAAVTEAFRKAMGPP